MISQPLQDLVVRLLPVCLVPSWLWVEMAERPPEVKRTAGNIAGWLIVGALLGFLVWYFMVIRGQRRAQGAFLATLLVDGKNKWRPGHAAVELMLGTARYRTDGSEEPGWTSALGAAGGEGTARRLSALYRLPLRATRLLVSALRTP